MDKTTYADIGSISSATLRSEDILPVFLECLRELATRANNTEHLGVCADVDAELDALETLSTVIDDLHDTYYASDSVSMLINETLMDALSCYALPYFYFGAHPGDGADFGFWLSEELEETFDGLKVADLSEVPNTYWGEVLHVNDHGNVSLYSCELGGKLTEVWAVV